MRLRLRVSAGVRPAFPTTGRSLPGHVTTCPWRWQLRQSEAIATGASFGPGLPEIRPWTEAHYAFSGYVTGFDPSPLIERRDELREELGYRAGERVVIVAVGGSGVGEALLRRVIAAYDESARLVPGLRMVVVTGPRLDPGTVPPRATSSTSSCGSGSRPLPRPWPARSNATP